MVGLLLISGILQGQTPAAPTGLSATPGVSGAYLSFTPPSGTVTDYEYTTNDGTLWSSTGTPQSPVFIPGLTNCTNYTIKIRAVNLTIKGDASAAVNTTPSGGTAAGINWTSRTSAADNFWSSVTYGNGMFVAVSTTSSANNSVMTSPDGINWTSRTPAANINWYNVTYGNGLFVALGGNGLSTFLMTSPDGINWTSRTPAADIYEWRAVTYGNGVFVAVASGGDWVMTSPDGIVWSTQPSAAQNSWTSVTYGNGLFVAVASSGIDNRVMTSPDGITWTIQISAANYSWESVTYGNGMFVAVANEDDVNGKQVMTSSDGINWTSQSSASNTRWRSVTFGNGLFVAIVETYTGHKVMTSPDGINWTSRTPAANNIWYSVTYGNGLYVAVAGNGTGNRVMTSTWAPASDAPTLSSVTGGDASATVIFTAPASDGGSAITGYDYSTDDGTTWTSTAATSSPITITGLSYGATYLVKLRAVNANGFSCPTAATTVTTTTPSAPAAPTGLSVTPEGNGAYISFTPPSGTVTDYEYTTNDGTLWSSTGKTQSPVFIPGLTNCTNYTIKIRAVNLTLKGTASDDLNTTTLGGTTGFNWTSRNAASAIIWSSVTYGKELFVAVSTVGTSYGVMTSPDGVNWTIRTSAAENSWNSVTYGNGLFVAVASSGTGNRVMTSPDGITWTSSTSAADNEWRSVTYGNGLFVAVASLGTGNRVMTSTDGVTWTIRTSAADNNWYSVTYGNGLFVAVASSGIGNRVMTSTDGITWTIGTSAVSNNWRCVTFANGLFVAVANTGTGNRVMTSPDGYTWSGRSASVNNPWNSVTYGNGLFVAVASLGTGNRVMTSPDGINWTSQSSAADNPWNSVTYGNGLYVAVAASGTSNQVMTSTWVQASSSPALSSVTGGDASATVAFTVPSTDGGYAISGYDYSNDDGTNWIRVSSTTSPFTITSLRHGTTYLVKLRAINANGFSCPTAATTVTTTTPSAPAAPTGLSATTGINGVYISFTPPSGTVTDYEYTTNDGSLWSSIGVPQGPVFIPSLTNCTNYTIKIRAVNQTLRGSASIAVIATPSEGKAAGINWTSQDAAVNLNWNSVVFGKELFVAVASGGLDNRVMTSADGITWTSRNSAFRNSWKSVTYGNGLFVAVSNDGTGNRVMTSPDGINWTSQSSAANNNWNSVTYGNGVFVAVASSGIGNRVMTSPDGINWTSRVSAADNPWNSVTFGNDIFVAVATSGTGNRVMTSPDGFTWTIRNYAAENYWRCVIYGNGLFVAVASTGAGNRVMTSTDGINWTIRNSAANASWYSVAYGNGLFVAVAYDTTGDRVMTSTDGVTWTTRSSESTSSNWFAMIFGNNRFAVVAYSGGVSSKRVMTSTWAPASDAPTLTSVTGGDASATVAFTAPASDGGSAITGYDYSTNDGTTWTSTAATSSPITITGLSHGTTYLVKLRAVNDNGFSCPTAASSVTIKIVYAWTGASSTAWNDVANWSQGSIPVTGDHVSIPTAATRNPTLDQDRDLLNLTVEAGRTLDLVTYTLSVKGSLSLNGTISGTGRLSLAGSSAQTVSGNGTVTNLEVNNNTGVTLGTGGNMLKVSGALIPTLGTLTTNGNLTLQSNASSTARIAPMPASGAAISGLVTVERYLPLGRKWRMLTAPLTGATNNSIFQHWQNNDVMSAGTGVEIWGPGGHADPSSDNTGLALGAGSSMRSYGTGWQNVINTNSSLLFDGSTNFGYALFAAGPYNNGTSIIGSSQAAQNTTLSATGTLITGDHTKSFTSIAGQYFLVGNPYASPVNPGSFTAAGPENRTNLSATLWMWDAKPGAGTGNGLGRYVSFDPSSNSYNVIGNGYGVNVMIQSGQAFFVQALADGPATLVFRETSKEVNGSHDMMGNALQSPKALLRFTLQQPISSDSSENLDGAVAVFHAEGRAGLDPLDGSKLMNSSENLYFRRESRNLTFEHRPVPGANDTLHLRMGNMQAMHYRLMAQASDFTGVDGLTAELTDRYTGRSVPLSLKGDTYFPFTVTPDSMSTGERFLVVFSKAAAPVVVAPDLPTQTNRLSVYPNPVREHLKVVVNLDMPQPFRLQVFDASGTEVWRQPSLAAGTRTVDINTSAFNSGMYTIVLTDAKGMTTVAKFIRE